MFHDNRKRGLSTHDESSLLKMAGIFYAKSNLHPIALLACPIFDSVPDHTPPPARIRGAVCDYWPYASSAGAMRGYLRLLLAAYCQSPTNIRQNLCHGEELGELSGLS